MKKWMIGLCMFAAFFLAANSFAAMIDDFNGGPYSQNYLCDGGGSDAIIDGGNTINGEYRYIVFLAGSYIDEGSVCTGSDSATLSIGEGLFSYDFTEHMQGELRIIWADCSSFETSCDWESLDVDLTESGTIDSFRIKILSNTAPGYLFLTVYTDTDNFSTAMLDIGDVTTSTDFYVPFSSFELGNGASGPADFTDVGAIEMSFGKDGVQNLVIDEIETAAFQPPPSTPEEQIEDIQDTFIYGIMSGDLSGAGPTENAAAGKLNAFANMLIEAEYLIDSGSTEEACNQLYSIYNKTDGIVPPPDFVTGDAAADLAAQILELMDSLGCEY